MAWLKFRSLVGALRNFDRDLLILTIAYFGLALLIVAGIWLNIELAWSFRHQPHAPPAVLASDSIKTAAAVSQAHLFGQAAAAVATAATSPEYHLLGLLASNRRDQGAAILQAAGGGNPQVVRPGQAIAPGLRLVELTERQAILSRDGNSITLSLPTPDAASPAALPSSPAKRVFD